MATKQKQITDRPRLGCHMSIAGGLHLALERAAACDSDIAQVFTKSNRQWKAKALDEQALNDWEAAREATGIEPSIAHAAYLIDLASANEELYEKSVAAMAIEIARCNVLEIPYLCFHPGAREEDGTDADAIKIGVKGMDEALERSEGIEAEIRKEVNRETAAYKTTVLIENTAGQGKQLGWHFDHLRDLLAGVAKPDRFGICIDTCHLFAAGYDLRAPEAYADTMDQLDKAVGLDRVLAFHINDSKKDLGSRVDRHDNIGEGKIGLDGFRNLMQDARFFGRPMALETPKGDDKGGGELDQQNLSALRSLLK